MYVAAVPLLIFRVTNGVTLGAIDFLFPLALIALLHQFTSRLTPASVFASVFLFAAATTTIAFMLGIIPRPVGIGAESALLIIRVIEIYIPYFLVTTWRELTAARARALTKVALVSGTIACAIGIFLHHAGVQVRDTQQVNWYGDGLGSSLRAGGILGNSGDFGHIAAIVGTCAITLGVLYQLKPIFLAFAFVTAAYATYLSSSRAAILHLLIATMCMIPVLMRGRRKLAAVSFILIAIIAVGVYLPTMRIGPQLEVTIRRLDILNITGESSFYASSSRLNTWDQMVELAAQNPLLGIGYGMTLPRVGSAGDNSFMSMIVEIGVVGGLAFFAFWVASLVSAARLPAGISRSVAIALVLSEIAHMLTVDTHSMWATTPVSVLLIALSLRSASLSTDRVRAESRVRQRARRGESI